VLRDVIAWIVADTTIPGLPLAFLLGAMVGVERELQKSTTAGLRSCVVIALATGGCPPRISGVGPRNHHRSAAHSPLQTWRPPQKARQRSVATRHISISIAI
jgi:hypothetical protein